MNKMVTCYDDCKFINIKKDGNEIKLKKSDFIICENINMMDNYISDNIGIVGYIENEQIEYLRTKGFLNIFFLGQDWKLEEAIDENECVINLFNSIILNTLEEDNAWKWELSHHIESGFNKTISIHLNCYKELSKLRSNLDFKSVHFIGNRNSIWLKTIMLFHKQWNINYSTNCNIVSTSYMKYKFKHTFLGNIIRITQYLFSYLKIGIKGKKEKIKCDHLIMLCLDTERHLQWLIPFISELKRRQSSYLILCLQANGNYKKLVSEDFNAINSESYITFSQLIKEMNTYIICLFKVNRNMKYYFHSKELNLYKFLKLELIYYLRTEVFRHYLVNCAIAGAMKKITTRTVRIWGEEEYVETQAMMNCISQNVVFYNEDTTFIKSIFKQPNYNKCDINFWKDKSAFELFKRKHGELDFSSDYFIGSNTLSDRRSFSDKIRVLWLPGNIREGIQSEKNISIEADYIVQSCMGLENLEVIIKLHPNSSKQLASELHKRTRDISNCILLDKDESTYKYYETVNVFVSDYSTALKEAIELGIIALKVIPQNEKYLQNYQIPCYTISDPVKLRKIFVKLNSIGKERDDLINKLYDKQIQYYSDNMKASGIGTPDERRIDIIENYKE